VKNSVWGEGADGKKCAILENRGYYSGKQEISEAPWFGPEIMNRENERPFPF